MSLQSLGFGDSMKLREFLTVTIFSIFQIQLRERYKGRRIQHCLNSSLRGNTNNYSVSINMSERLKRNMVGLNTRSLKRLKR